MVEKKILRPDPSRLIEGLRDTGYDFNTALADIVDNSLAAGATSVNVSVAMDFEGCVEVSIADDGCGMDETALMNAMKYGSTTRPNPLSLGKFGLGLKTASTAFCRCLTVVSRPSGDSPPLRARWDLDHVAEVRDWELLVDEPDRHGLELLEATAEDRAGTVVLWERVDRLIKNYKEPNGKHARNAIDRVVEGFRLHASMVYQRFLDPDDHRAPTVCLKVNGNPVEAWDPFCRGEEETEKVAEKIQAVSLPDGSESKFEVTAFVLPRRSQMSDERNARLLTNKMQGIYVYRENRLIHGPDWLGIFIKEPHLTLLRVEFSFDQTLDEVFDVDIKKSRILLNEVLYNWLQNGFLPAPRNAANERYRSGRKEKAGEVAKGAHDASNKGIASKEEAIRISDVEVQDPSTGEVLVTNPKGTIALKLPIDAPSNPNEVTVHPVEGIDDGLLWEPCLIGTHHAVRINRGHPYYHKVYLPNLGSDVTVEGMDALLWALSEAELGTVNEATKTHFLELRFVVSKLLRALVADLPEPDLGEDDQ